MLLFINEDTEFLESGAPGGADNDAVVVAEEAVDPAVTEMDALIAEEAPLDCFSGDDMGAVEICLEMETSWAAMVRDMTAIEHKSIVNENAELLNEGLKNWWDAVVRFFTSMWKAISAWFSKALLWISTRFQNAGKWWAANQAKISKTDTSFNTYPAVAHGVQSLDAFVKYTAALGAAQTKEAVQAAVGKGAPKEVLTEMLGAAQRSEQTITKAAIDKNLKSASVCIAGFKTSHATQAKALQDGIAAAKKGQAAAGDGAAALKATIDADKAKLSALKALDAQALKAMNTIVSDSFMAAKKMLRESGAPAAA
jgi:hypothetical protein